MGASVVLYRGIEKTLNSKDRSGNSRGRSRSAPTIDDKKDKIGDLFIKSGFMLPVDLMKDLFQFYIDSGRDEQPLAPTDSDSLRDLAYHLVDVIDLFDMDYDNIKDPVKLEEWIVIKDLFSAYAADIDDDLLTYVMQYAIEKGIWS